VLNTIQRAGTVLSMFTEERAEWGVREIAAELNMPRSNVHELLSSLASIGLLRRTRDARYRLGWRLLTLSGQLVNSNEVARVGSALLHQLAARHRHSVSIAVCDGGEVVSIGQAEPQGSAPVSRIGDRMPMHSTATGKIMLAHHEADVGQLRLERFTTRTITDPQLLARTLAAVRRDDVAYDERETDDAIVCIASPIRDSRNGVVIAALSMSVAPAVFEQERFRLAQSVQRAARQVSALLGRESKVATITNAPARLEFRARAAEPPSAAGQKRDNASA
jgi:DNA-binding IclR family transcriptional regulator